MTENNPDRHRYEPYISSYLEIVTSTCLNQGQRLAELKSQIETQNLEWSILEKLVAVSLIKSLS